MLKNLLIKNYALIKHLEMEPSAQLNIITGETGAGKSIMLGAVGLLLGKRADTKTLFDEHTKCIIEGTFDLSTYDLQSFFQKKDLDYEEICIIRREISPSGKSRAFVNDIPVTLDILRQLGGFLMDIHSQHDTLMLGSNMFQLYVIDSYAGNQMLLSDYKHKFKQFKNTEDAYNKMLSESAEIKKAADYNQFLLEELSALRLSEGEQETLEKDLQVLEHAEEIKTRLNIALEILGNSDQAVITNLYNTSSTLKQIAGYSEKYQVLLERTESCLIELKDVAAELENEEMKVEFDTQKTEQVKERLSNIYQLQQKHQVDTVEALLQLQSELEAKVNKVMHLDEDIEEARNILAVSEKSMKEAAHKLSESRTNVLKKAAKEIIHLLKDLGMPDANLEIGQRETVPTLSGVDEINFLFSANKGIKPQELKNVASGGEFSRVMFCIKYILADKTSLPTIVFDEIDAGISGEIAIKMTGMMKSMAKNHQVIAISHLPQIAAGGNVHYFVYKDNTSEKAVSKIRKLGDDERILEIAKMIGGDNPSDTAYENAKELIRIN